MRAREKRAARDAATAARPKRGRKRKSVVESDEDESDDEQEAEPTAKGKRGRKRKRAVLLDEDESDEDEPETEPQTKVARR